MLVTTFWCEKIGTQKILKTTLFQDKLYSLKALAHYFTVLIHLATWRAAKLDIFTHFTSTNLPWCSLNSLTYAQSIYICPAAFYEFLITVLIALPCTIDAPKYFCICQNQLAHPGLSHTEPECQESLIQGKICKFEYS